MTFYVIFSILILAFSTTFFECIGANIFIKKTDNQTDEITFECGENKTLTCMFKKNKTIEWMNKNNSRAIAMCVLNTCTLNPDYGGQYSISADMQRNIFNLTILKITRKDDGRRLVCSDGSHTDSVLLRDIDYKPQIFEDTHSGTVKVTSGCVSQRTKVSFKWTRKINTFEEEFFPQLQSNYSTNCSSDVDCRHYQHIRYTEIVYVTANEVGKYHFKIVAVHGNKSKESNIVVEMYIIESKRENNGNLLIEHIVVIIIASLILICMYLYRDSKEEKLTSISSG
ncbi:uncharacterized protein LOC132741086 [Ruditapes philippinarum]|uniref:uncharacterized protein LOC132741086 n=1 Tax=Ruditapes philippinarum TaxID=129788 RepID=UPI00295C21A0|nr:uncharacterized protein LOC132741086 [Ruditapes philippinarum]